MGKLPRHPCPVCGRSIAATATTINAAWRDGKLVRYVYLRSHNNTEAQPCSGTGARDLEYSTSPGVAGVLSVLSLAMTEGFAVGRGFC